MQITFELWEVIAFGVLMIVLFFAYGYEYMLRRYAEYLIESQKELIKKLLKDYNINVVDEE